MSCWCSTSRRRGCCDTGLIFRRSVENVWRSSTRRAIGHGPRSAGTACRAPTDQMAMTLARDLRHAVPEGNNGHSVNMRLPLLSGHLLDEEQKYLTIAGIHASAQILYAQHEPRPLAGAGPVFGKRLVFRRQIWKGGRFFTVVEKLI